MAPSTPTLDDVLEAFAMEPLLDSDTLKRYLRSYPEFGTELVDYSQEVFRSQQEDERSLGDHDRARVDSAWSRFQAVAEHAVPAFAQMDAGKLGGLAKMLSVPRQVVLAFRERGVIVSSVPRRILLVIAEYVGASVQDLTNYLSLPKRSLARSFKSGDKPSDTEKVTFERLLHDAGLERSEIERLLADEP